MKLSTITLLMALFAMAYSWESMGLGNTDPAHPGKCVLYDMILSPGEEATVKGSCISVFCDNAEGDTTIQGCGVVAASPPCIVGKTKYPNAPYPECCEKEIICPE